MGNTSVLTLEAVTRHWLLNAAVEVPVRLIRLFPQIAGEALNVREVPGCGPKDYAKALIELFDSPDDSPRVGGPRRRCGVPQRRFSNLGAFR
jgi:hypothetical protein